MKPSSRKFRFATRAVHAGEAPDPITGASSPNLVMSSTFVADPGVNFSVESDETKNAHVYTRWSNPTLDQLERKLADLEGAEAGLVFGSGMAAISGLLMNQLKAGDELVMSDVTYAGASELANETLPNMGIKVKRVDMSNLAAVAAAVTPATKLVYAETPANPIMRLTDIAAVAEIAKANNAEFVVDSTFASPVGTLPIALGADYVIQSITKYLGGHGDAIGGAVLGKQAPLANMRQKILVHGGGILSPFNAWLILRGIATLPLRMRAHQEGALKVAQFLESHPKIKRVMYPGLPSHPQHDLATRQMANFSGMLSFQVEDGNKAARAFADHCEVFHYAVSLGHHRSLLFYMDTDSLLQSSFWLTEAQQASYRAFAGNGIFRTSIGIEDPDDLCEDLEEALRHL